jgi:3-phenylpropionate/trans-cinnamate dioxygenase ferredoxin reductase component
MPNYKYLILGGGMTADAAVRGIREIDRSGSIGVLSSEACAPYNRPPLSKGLWKGGKLEDIWRKTETVAGVTLHLQTTAVQLDRAQKFVLDDRQTKYTYEKLLIATGGTPRRLPSGNDSIIYFRTLDDYQRLHALAEGGTRFAVIGGGFIGSEIAAALRMNQKQVVMAFLEDGICARVFPPDLAKFVTELYRQKGVEVIPEKTVEGVAAEQGRFRVRLSGMNPTEVDGVVAGLGIIPNTQLAAGAGLEVSDGIVVDELLRTSAEDIYAAGDVAAFHNPALGKRIRVEHEDNANTTGRTAGRNIAGASERYDHLPSFYSDLFELGYEAVGQLDPRLQTVSKWKEQFREGIVYYLEQGRIRGVLLWNVWEKLDAARAAINSGKVFTAAELDSLIPV